MTTLEDLYFGNINPNNANSENVIVLRRSEFNEIFVSALRIAVDEEIVRYAKTNPLHIKIAVVVSYHIDTSFFL